MADEDNAHDDNGKVEIRRVAVNASPLTELHSSG
jgi:hypothetical protein